MNDSIPTRIPFIDVVKGMGIYLVILGHLVIFDGRIFHWIFAFHMPLFFFVAGYCFNPKKYQHFYPFLKARCKSLLLPYFGFVIFGLFLSLIPIFPMKITGYPLFLSIFYYTRPQINGIGAVWFLMGLFWAEIFYYTARRLLTHKPLFFSILFWCAVAYLGAHTHGIHVPIFSRIPWCIDSALTGAVFIAIGNVFRERNLFSFMVKYKYVVIPLAFMNILFWGWLHNGYVNVCDCTYDHLINYYIGAISGIIFVSLLAYTRQNSCFWKYYGRNSLPIFALHGVLLSLISPISSCFMKRSWIPMQTIPDFYAIIISIVVLLLMFPIVLLYKRIVSNMYWFYDKLPFSRQRGNRGA